MFFYVENYLSAICNLVNELIDNLRIVNITAKQARDIADIVIFKTGIEDFKPEKNSVLIREDVLVN